MYFGIDENVWKLLDDIFIKKYRLIYNYDKKLIHYIYKIRKKFYSLLYLSIFNFDDNCSFILVYHDLKENNHK